MISQGSFFQRMQMMKIFKKIFLFIFRSLFSVVGLAIIILVFRWSLFEPYVIPSGSMLPSLLIFDHIIVNKMSYGTHIPFTTKWLWKRKDPQRGDVVVFRPLNVEGQMRFLIKRIVAIGGDVLYIDEQNQLWINDKKVARVAIRSDRGKRRGFYPLTELDLGALFSDFSFYVETTFNKRDYRIIFEKALSASIPMEFQVPEGHIFLMGDNRDNSHDSRFWGSLPVSHVIGKAVRIWLSCEETLFSLPLLCYPHKIRYKRLFRKIR